MGNELRLKLKSGIDKAANATRVTLGPVGMTALIEYKGLDPIQCDDGVTILKNIDLKDPYEQMGVQMLRKGALRTSSEGGDGTATTTVLTQALVAEAFKEIANDSSKIRDVKERLEAGLKETLSALTKLKRDVTTDDIEKIATISSLDPEVAKLISDIIKEVGINGVVSVEKGAQLGYTKEVVKGARFDKGLISPYFINDPANQRTVLNDAYIVLVDRKVSTNEQVISLLNSIGLGKDILFIADTVDSVALATLAQNAMNKVANIACVQNPYSASRARDFLTDIACLTGATVISEEKGMRLDDATAILCGRAEKVIITRDTTTIIGGAPSDELQDRIIALKMEIASTTSEYQKLMLEERLACLTGGIGVIRVGAYTDTEFNAKKYKFENAINATQAALQEGIVPGGGVGLGTVSHQINEPMFKSALKAPIVQMALNAGMQRKKNWFSRKSADWIGDWIGSPMINTTLKAYKISVGYDFKTKQFADMFKEGIIDPFKVTRIALESATAIASALVSVETAIINEVEDEKATR
jgi:chaperonin GroEL